MISCVVSQTRVCILKLMPAKDLYKLYFGFKISHKNAIKGFPCISELEGPGDKIHPKPIFHTHNAIHSS